MKKLILYLCLFILTQVSIAKDYTNGTVSSDQLPTLAPNLNIHIPTIEYQSLGEKMNLWVDLQFSTTDDGKMSWVLDNYGINTEEQPKQKKSAYFIYTQAGNFDKKLDEIIGSDHDLSTINFRKTPFKIFIEQRLLSRINYNGKSGYGLEDILFKQNVNEFAHILSVKRSVAEEDGCRSPTVPDSVFGESLINKDKLTGIFKYLNISKYSDVLSEVPEDVYIFKFEARERWATPGQGCYPSIHSDKYESEGVIVSPPTFTGYTWTGEGYFNSYGNGAYVYIDNNGEIHFKYKTQNNDSRSIFSIGILIE